MSAPEQTVTTKRRRWRHGWDVIVVLVDRDLKLMYKRSILGLGWALAAPLLQLLVYTLVFRRKFSDTIDNYPAYVFTGVLIWGWFQSALQQATGLITGSKALVRQPGFPLDLLPHVTVGVRLFHLMVALPVLEFLLWSRGIYPSWPWAALPLLVVIQFLLTVGLAYPLAALNVRLRDTQHLIGVLLSLMMFTTPIFYSADIVPEKFRFWYQLNPLAVLVEAWRAVLIHGVWPNFSALGVLASVSALAVIAGRQIFIQQSHRFVEEM